MVLELLEPMSEAVIDERSSWEMQGLNGPAELRVLMVDDSSQRAEELLNTLRVTGYAVRPAFVKDREQFTETLQKQIWDLVLTNPQVADMGVEFVCGKVHERHKHTPVVVVAEKDPQNLAAVALQHGAADVVARSNIEHLQLVVRRELRRLDQARQVGVLRERAEEAERRCMSLLDSSRDALAYVHDGMHVYANSSYLRLFGYEGEYRDELEGLPLLDLVSSEHATKLRDSMRALSKRESESQQLDDLTGVRSDGAKVSVSMQLARANFDGEPCMLVMAHDLSERKQFERKLRHLKRRDPTTGLFNHRHMRAKLDSLGKAANAGVQSAVMLIELDNFENIRRTLGITLTNDIVRDVARVLKKSVGERDHLARMTEKTFSVLLPEQGLEEASTIAEKLRFAIQEHIWDHAGHSVATTCSVGMGIIDPDRPNPELVLEQVDRAVHEAVSLGGNVVRVFQPDERDLEAEAATVELSLAVIDRAFDEERASLLFQPIVDLAGESTEIYEILLSLKDRSGAPFANEDIFKILEASGEAGKVDLWMLEHTIAASNEHKEQDRNLRLFVKLSGQTLRDQATLKAICQTAQSTQLPPGAITFELSVEAVKGQVKYAKMASSAFHKAGCQVALSHFGLELADFNLLRHVETDYLMLAPALLNNIAKDHDAQTRLATLQERAQMHEKLTIATAVQDPHALTVLWRCGIQYALGYYIQEPSQELAYDSSVL